MNFRYTILAILSAFLMGSAMAGSPKPVGENIELFLENWPNHAVNRHLAELPKGVRALCADARGRLAAPGDKWRMTDYITPENRTLPASRLVWFTRSNNVVLAYCQKGGLAPTSYILAVKVAKKSKPHVLWRAYAPWRLDGFYALIDALHNGNILRDD